MQHNANYKAAIKLFSNLKGTYNICRCYTIINNVITHVGLNIYTLSHTKHLTCFISNGIALQIYAPKQNVNTYISNITKQQFKTVFNACFKTLNKKGISYNSLTT